VGDADHENRERRAGERDPDAGRGVDELGRPEGHTVMEGPREVVSTLSINGSNTGGGGSSEEYGSYKACEYSIHIIHGPRDDDEANGEGRQRKRPLCHVIDHDRAALEAACRHAKDEDSVGACDESLCAGQRREH